MNHIRLGYFHIELPILLNSSSNQICRVGESFTPEYVDWILYILGEYLNQISVYEAGTLVRL